MSPRKTRLGLKSEGVNETMSETISKKTGEETPAESQRIKRTRRQLVKISSVESDVDQTPEVVKSKRKVVQETPSSKATRSRKKLTLETTVGESSDAGVIPTKRTRRRKENDTLSEQTIVLDSTTMEDSRFDKSRETRTRKKVAKKSTSKSEDESTEAVPNKRINASMAKNVTIIDDGLEDVTSSDTTVPMTIEDTEVHQVSSTISRFKAAMTTPGKRRPRNAKLPTVECTPESSPLTVNLTPHRTTKTPRKSPMNLSSPKSHAEMSLRLSKTPRKLPIAAESPVPSGNSVTSSTHSTPVKSPNLNALDTSDSKKKHRSPKPKLSPKGDHKSSSKVLSLRKFSKSPKIVLRSPKVKSTKIKSPRVVASKVKKTPLPKRSTKSPVKSIKSPNAGPPIGSVVKKSSSPKKAKESLSPKKAKESLSPKKAKEPLNSKKAKKSLSPKKAKKSLSPKKAKKSLSPKRSVKFPDAAKLLESRGTRLSIHLSRVDSPTPGSTSPTVSRNSSLTVQSKQLVQSPTVTLNKISVASVSSPETVTRSRKNALIDDSAKSTPIPTESAEKLSFQGAESPRRSKSVGKKRALITNSGTPLRATGTPRVSAVKLAAGKSMILSSNSTPMDIAQSKIGSGGPMLSSTPRERIRRSLNLSPGLGVTLGVIDSPANGATPVGSSTLVNEGRGKRRSLRIEDESNPLISEDESAIENPSGSESRLNGIYEIDATVIAEKEEENPGNGTYELAEPTTPHLRKRAAKRSLSEMDASFEEKAFKRTCRVRFASPPPGDNENKAVATVIGRSRSATPAYRAGQKLGSGRRVTGNETSGNDKFRRRSSSMTNLSLIKTPVTKRRSNSVADGNVRSANRKEQNASVNRLSKPRLSITSSVKKQEVKTPIARKAPNFAQIHQRKFAKMESIIDAKKRVEKRHIAMTSQIPTSISREVNNVPPKPTVSGKATTPSTAVNGAYNRYGFKLRKNDAVKIMTQKQPTHTSNKKQTENRMLLKGVRTNRRFDLIMKARNINQ